ncbi:MAG TPA: hypothetical protein VFZ65_13350 [Planctomycetota bacterium]|nr:hypothetical protein [Planctomycetota bacterium]
MKLRPQTSDLRPQTWQSAALPQVLAAGIMALFATVGSVRAQATPQQSRYLTHDWTVPVGGENGDFREWGADVKTPGDGFTYSALTITVRDTNAAPQFSGAGVGLPLGVAGFTLGPANQRQVGLLQITNAAQAIVNPLGVGLPGQFYFYGQTPGQPTRATNVRGVSVWPAAAVADTRIAICGEAYDQAIPLSQLGPVGGWPASSATNSSGFIAVFDGAGNLLWSHQFFGANDMGSCAITDVSLRVVFNAAGAPVQDVVTYCGISSFGNPVPNAELATTREFVAPAAGAGCSLPAGGATNNGVGQWDGIVGRLTAPHLGVGPLLPDFQSIVGGVQQDGLFGIAEIDAERFVVVGSTGTSGVVGAGGASFPLTTGVCLNAAVGAYALGVRMVFNVPAAGPIVLETSQELGSLVVAPAGLIPANQATVARDVLVQQGYKNGTAQIVVVGSTDDPNLLNSFAGSTPGPQVAINGTGVAGATDGFVLSVWDVAPGVLAAGASTFRGGAGNDGLTGINGWNEFTDHFAVTGRAPVAGGDIDVATYFQDIGSATGLSTPFTELTGGPAGAPPGPMGVQVGGALLDYPTAMGAINTTVTVPGLVFNDFGLGDPAGGGIAVGPTARVNVVGTTNSADFPVTPAMPPRYPLPAGRPKMGAVEDAVRTVFDMLPVDLVPAIDSGVGRTDGTGIPAPALAPAPGPLYPLPGFAGGTTPDCGLAPFGRQIGLPVPAIPRMLIDYAGSIPAGGVTMQAVVSRPAPTAIAEISAWDLGFPGAAGPIVLPGNALLWTTATPVTLGYTIVDAPVTQAFLLPVVGAPVTFTVQLIVLHSVAVPGGALAPAACPGTTTVSASPALWVSY